MFDKLQQSFGTQLIVRMGGILAVALIFISGIFYQYSSHILNEDQLQNLRMVNAIKQSEIKLTFQTLTSQLNSLSQLPVVQDALRNSANAQILKKLTLLPELQLLNNKVHLYFVEGEKGKIIFQSHSNALLNQAVFDAEMLNSKLHRLFVELKNNSGMVFSDFDFFEPEGHNAPAFGISVPGKGAIIAFFDPRYFNQLMNSGLQNSNFSYKIFLVDQAKNIANAPNSNPLNTVLELRESTNENTLFNFTDPMGGEMKALAVPFKLPEFKSGKSWFLVTAIPLQQSTAPLSRLKIFVSLTGLLILLIAGLLIYFFGAKISKPLRKISHQLHDVNQGKLNVEIPLIPQKNELGLLTQNLKDFSNRLREQMRDIIEHTNTLASSASEISATVAQITASSSETATAITQTASSSEEVTQLANSFNQKAKESLAIGDQTVQLTNEGTAAFNTIDQVIQQVQSQMDQIANMVLDLSKHSQTIGEITDAVKEIAEQSNILAINASIEATKAGEFGKGFAVVANEVRNLSEQSRKSTLQIQNILDSIQDAIGKTVMQVEQGTKTINSSVNAVQQARSSMVQMADSIEKLIGVLTEIADFAQEQLNGTAQIKEAMENIKEATSQNVDGMHQLEEVIDNLKETGESLRQLVSQYQVD